MVQEVTSTSWGKRILNALWGIFFGIALIFGAIFLIFWNEGKGLHTAQALEQAEKNLVEVPNNPVNSQNDLRAIYITGLATTNDILKDELFNVSEKAIQLSRHVEMYQWEEKSETKTEKQLGGSEQEIKTYNYHQVWSDQLIDSTYFKDQTNHQNPRSMPLKTKIEYAEHVTLGGFTLPKSLITQISGHINIDLGALDIPNLKSRLNKPIHPEQDSLFIGEDSSNPKIGDMKVSMSMVLPTTVSIIAQQKGSSLQPYTTQNGHSVLLLETGLVSSQQMIHNALVENKIFMWILRGVSLLALIFGFALIFQPVVVLADVVPLFGSLVGFGVGVIAFVCGTSLWAMLIALAWFSVRPLFSLSLVLIALLICAYWIYRKKKIREKN